MLVGLVQKLVAPQESRIFYWRRITRLLFLPARRQLRRATVRAYANLRRVYRFTDCTCVSIGHSGSMEDHNWNPMDVRL